ncbi:hypothetical protein [Bifidobacterium aquikefiri]
MKQQSDTIARRAQLSFCEVVEPSIAINMQDNLAYLSSKIKEFQ